MPRHTGHGERTAFYSLSLGKAIGLTPSELHQLKLAALLHDIGLLMLPPHVLSAPDACLETDDYALVQSHPRAGAELLEPYRFLRPAALLIAHHHERWDGSGYPFGLRGPFIPLGSRILAIADAFDAIQAHQHPDAPVHPAIALRILRLSAGSQFDPELVETFRRVVNASHDAPFSCPRSQQVTPPTFQTL